MFNRIYSIILVCIASALFSTGLISEDSAYKIQDMKITKINSPIRISGQICGLSFGMIDSFGISSSINNQANIENNVDKPKTIIVILDAKNQIIQARPVKILEIETRGHLTSCYYHKEWHATITPTPDGVAYYIENNGVKSDSVPIEKRLDFSSEPFKFMVSTSEEKIRPSTLRTPTDAIDMNERVEEYTSIRVQIYHQGQLFFGNAVWNLPIGSFSEAGITGPRKFGGQGHWYYKNNEVPNNEMVSIFVMDGFEIYNVVFAIHIDR